ARRRPTSRPTVSTSFRATTTGTDSARTAAAFPAVAGNRSRKPSIQGPQHGAAALFMSVSVEQAELIGRCGTLEMLSRERWEGIRYPAALLRYSEQIADLLGERARAAHSSREPWVIEAPTAHRSKAIQHLLLSCRGVGLEPRFEDWRDSQRQSNDRVGGERR